MFGGWTEHTEGCSPSSLPGSSFNNVRWFHLEISQGESVYPIEIRQTLQISLQLAPRPLVKHFPAHHWLSPCATWVSGEDPPLDLKREESVIISSLPVTQGPPKKRAIRQGPLLCVLKWNKINNSEFLAQGRGPLVFGSSSRLQELITVRGCAKRQFFVFRGK